MKQFKIAHGLLFKFHFEIVFSTFTNLNLCCTFAHTNMLTSKICSAQREWYQNVRVFQNAAGRFSLCFIQWFSMVLIWVLFKCNNILQIISSAAKTKVAIFLEILYVFNYPTFNCYFTWVHPYALFIELKIDTFT